VILFVMALTLQSLPQTPPFSPSLSGDARLQIVTYGNDQVVPLRVAPGFAAVVELGSEEHVDNVVVGNSETWQVTPNRTGDRLVVKPLAGATNTNMIVLTDTRQYVFLLEPDRGGAGTFVLQFRYSAGPVAPLVTVQHAAEYKIRGDKGLLPIAMEDDGHSTTITWDPDAALPAIFAVENGKEALVNGRMIDSDYVIEGVADRYVFRRGKQRATAKRKLLKTAR
jgi:type IV secretion system protein VirB9